MTPLPPCIVYSQNAALLRRLQGFLGSIGRVHPTRHSSSLLTVCGQFDPAILLIDLCAANSHALLTRIMDDHPDLVVLAVAPPDMENRSAMEQETILTVVDADCDRRTLQSAMRRAVRQWSLLQENKALRAADLSKPPAPPPRVRRGEAAPASLFHFSGMFRNYERLETRLEHLVEGVARCARIPRVGLFAAESNGKTYRLKAGVKCLEGTDQLEFTNDDPLLCWMRMHPHLISKSMLAHCDHPTEASFLGQMLDTLGAEIILPLHARGRLAGWMFFGRRHTGFPFEETDYEELAGLTDHVSVLFENSLLCEEVRLQKTLAETLLRSMPAGIVAVNTAGRIRWCNDEAQSILGTGTEVLHQPVDVLGSHLSDRILQCLRGQVAATEEWTPPRSGRVLHIQTRPLLDGDICMGAMLLLHDKTEEHRLRKKQEQMERATFWNEMAAALSHEVRNPLVTVSTFAQLLQERYNDPEFRKSFSDLASKEIQRVHHLLNQIDAFANRPEPHFQPVHLDAAIEKALALAHTRVADGNASILVRTDPGLPPLQADEPALIEAVAHLIVNAIEAGNGEASARTTVTAGPCGSRSAPEAIRIDVEDNGKGMPPEIEDNVFSPFCSSKPHGVGLGLPIVKRTVTDHNGKLSLEKIKHGTRVSMELPIHQPQPPAAPARSNGSAS